MERKEIEIILKNSYKVVETRTVKDTKIDVIQINDNNLVLDIR